jgi:radical SAM protein with 4Fe4S-binding SPASM domain
MRCSFCYSEGARKDSTDLPLTVLTDFVDSNESKINSINYGTGENTLSSTWFELIRVVRDRYPRIEQALTTNGYLAVAVNRSPNYREFVRECVDEVDVSLDFADRNRHTTLRGHPQAYDWAMETLDLVRADGLIPTIVFVGLDETMELDNLSALVALAREKDAFLRLNIFRPNGEKKSRLTYATLMRGMRYLLESCSVVCVSDPLIAAVLLSQRAVDHTGIRSARILPDGSVTPATYLVEKKWETANICDRIDLSELPRTANFHIFSGNVVPQACRDCRVSGLCGGGTKDRRLIWYGTLSERDPYCPFRNGNQLPSPILPKQFSRSDGRPTIHAAYLPTVVLFPGARA